MKAADPLWWLGGVQSNVQGYIGGLIKGKPHQKLRLIFFYCDGACLADFHAGFAAQAFFFVYRNRFAILKLIHFHRAYVHAFATASTFVSIDSHSPTHCFLQLFFSAPNAA
jgi:hypothetical protein